MTPQKLEKLEQIFRVVFELSRDSNVAGVSQISQPNWDSLRHVTLVAALENEFDISIDIADSLGLNSFEAARRLLEERGA